MEVALNNAPGFLSRVAANPYVQQAAVKALARTGKFYWDFYSRPSSWANTKVTTRMPRTVSRYRKRGRYQTKAPGGAGSYRQGSYKKRRKAAYKKAKARRPKSRYKLTRTVNRLSKQVKNLQYAENASLGTFIHRVLFSVGAITSVDGKQYGVYELAGLRMAEFKDSVQYLKYYNPATPGTLTTADFETGTYDRRVLFKSVYFGMTARNNYQTDCLVRVYLCTPVQSSSIDVEAAWDDGVTANSDSTVTSRLQVGQFPTDYADFKNLWKAKLHCKATLSPGQSLSCSHSVKNIEFDPTALDNHAASYQSKYKNFQFLVVVEGVISHDSVTTSTRGLAQAGVDVHAKRVSTIQYDAGVNIKFARLDNNNGTMLSTAVQSHQPVPDNVGYSTT